MKAIRCHLRCFTRWGSECYRKDCDSLSEAKKIARELIDEKYALSYIIFSYDKRQILKK